MILAMGDIEALTEINFVSVFLGVFIVIIAFNKIVEVVGKAKNNIDKPMNWFKNRNKDHEMILANAQAIKDLAELHEKDNQISNEHDEKIREEMSTFMREVRSDIKKFTENRVHDREQSREIQKELNNSIKAIVDSQRSRDEQIEALMCGSKELLGNTIDERYEKYIALKGIPQNEVDEFDSIYAAYKGLHGNHGRQTKYEYVKEHLPVIPVKTTLITNEK